MTPSPPAGQRVPACVLITTALHVGVGFGSSAHPWPDGAETSGGVGLPLPPHDVSSRPQSRPGGAGGRPSPRCIGIQMGAGCVANSSPSGCSASSSARLGAELHPGGKAFRVCGSLTDGNKIFTIWNDIPAGAKSPRSRGCGGSSGGFGRRQLLPSCGRGRRDPRRGHGVLLRPRRASRPHPGAPGRCPCPLPPSPQLPSHLPPRSLGALSPACPRPHVFPAPQRCPRTPPGPGGPTERICVGPGACSPSFGETEG